MSLDLNKLANKLDEALSNETTETLNKFLNDKTMSNNKQRKDLLNKFYQSFIRYTLDQIKCRPIDRGVAYGGWFEIIFPNALDCEDLILIGKFIKEKFSQEGLYSHLLPKITTTEEGVSLIVQDREIERISNTGKI